MQRCSSPAIACLFLLANFVMVQGFVLTPALRALAKSNSIVMPRSNKPAVALRRSTAAVTAPKMIMDGLPLPDQIMQLSSAVSAAPAIAEILYDKAFTANPTLIDAMTGMSLYYLGQRTKGVISRAQPTWDVISRWMVIGLFDGFSSHEWYSLLEHTIPSLGLEHVPETALMTAITAALFTPTYCAAFLGGLSLLEGKGTRGALERIHHDFAELAKTTVSTWSIFNVYLFGFVNVDHRVVVAMTAHYFYLIGLALWNEAVQAGKSASAANLQQEMPWDSSESGLRLAVPYQADDVPPLDSGSDVNPIA